MPMAVALECQSQNPFQINKYIHRDALKLTDLEIPRIHFSTYHGKLIS
jgi:hypothetical protein